MHGQQQVKKHPCCPRWCKVLCLQVGLLFPSFHRGTNMRSVRHASRCTNKTCIKFFAASVCLFLFKVCTTDLALGERYNKKLFLEAAKNWPLTEPYISKDSHIFYECAHWIEQDVTKWKQVDQNLVEPLRWRSNFSQEYLTGRSCAVVGASGILRESLLGSEIDAHDVVIRFGVPPLIKEVSGLKTNILLLNPSAITLFDTELHSVISHMNPQVISLNCCVTSCYKLASSLHRKLDAWNRILTASDCRYNLRVLDLLEKKFSWQSSGSTPRSGILFSFPFLESCLSVDFYGFWPFKTDCDGREIPYHYWNDEDGGVNPVHDDDADFSALFRIINSYGQKANIVLPPSASCKPAQKFEHANEEKERKVK